MATKIDPVVWVQSQAPAGNWVDVLGIPYKPQTKDEALGRARNHAEYLRREQHTTSRVVIKSITVV